MFSKETLIATNRFGLGANLDDISKARVDPKKWLKAQISLDHTSPKAFAGLATSRQLLEQAFLNRRIKDEDTKKKIRKIRRQQFNKALLARLINQIETQQPFAERLVMFWSNHFTVSRTRGFIGPAIPAYENEAIRPFIFGSFEDMLISVAQHPCMLIYLDNISSIGPNSIGGIRREKDLNENLAREFLELHTLGAQGDYTQSDVTNFAKILTGWTVVRRPKNQRVPAGTFQFDNRIHEPGPQRLLGKDFNQGRKAQGVEALKEIARQPATAKLIATKLVRHFVNDTPPARAVDMISRVFSETNGDLAEVSKALIKLEVAWQQTGTKIKSPEELVISTFRALRGEGPVSLPRRRLLFAALKSMGQEIFHAPSPAGWPDIEVEWVAPESLMRRIEWIHEISQQSSTPSRPLEIFKNTIAPFASDKTTRLIRGAPSREDGLALIFSSPAFQRR